MDEGQIWEKYQASAEYRKMSANCEVEITSIHIFVAKIHKEVQLTMIPQILDKDKPL
jgi:uncharacterized integral membrane protein